MMNRNNTDISHDRRGSITRSPLDETTNFLATRWGAARTIVEPCLQGSPLQNAFQRNESEMLRMRPDVISNNTTPGSFKFFRRKSLEQPKIDCMLKYKVPDLILEKIFSYLNKKDLCNALRSCRRFAIIASSSMQWTRVDLSGRKFKDVALVAVLSHNPAYLRLADTNVALDTYHTLQRMPFIDMSKLTHFDCSRAQFADQRWLCDILMMCRNISCLSLEAQSINDDVCIGISNSTNLTQLDLSMTTGLTFKGWIAINRKCTRLEQLSLSWCGADAEVVGELCSNVSPRLTHLNMSGTLNKTSMVDADVEQLVFRCPRLVDLDLSDNSDLTERALAFMLRLKQLTVLSLNRCYSIKPFAFCECISIRRLNVFGCIVEQGLEALRVQLPATQVNRDALNYTAKPSNGSSHSYIWGRRVADIY